MTKDIEISIVIPVYNASSYLRETLQSVQNQSYKNWEIICVDDNSTDNSLMILKRIREDWKTNGITQPFEIISLTKHKGPAIARNKGIQIAKGNYLTFLDADDIWDKNKLEKQLKFMKEKNCAFSFTGYEFANEQAIRNGKVVHVPNEISYKEALKNTTISTITVMFDRGKIPTNLLLMPENCTREDTATWWKILKHGYIAYGLDEALSVYRRHSNSYSSNKWKAVLGTWNMYRVQEQMSVVTSAWYLFFNLWNAVKRRV